MSDSNSDNDRDNNSDDDRNNEYDDEPKKILVKPHLIHRGDGSVLNAPRMTTKICSQCKEATGGTAMGIMEKRHDTSTLICNHCGFLEHCFNTDYDEVGPTR